ncbi:CYC02 protein, partial [Melia azedarach]
MRALTCLVLLFAVVLPIPSILAAVTPEEDAAKETNNVQVGDAKSRCNNCCGGWSYGRCNRWCCSPNEAKPVDTQAVPQEPEAADQKSNQVDDAKAGCNKCCGGWSYGRCKRWCCGPNEANTVDAEVLPAENSEAADQQSNPQVGDEKQPG